MRYLAFFLALAIAHDARAERLWTGPIHSSSEPAVDVSCSLSQEERSARIQFIKAQIRANNADLATVYANRLALQEVLSAMDYGYAVSKGFMGIAFVAGIASVSLMIHQVYFLKQAFWLIEKWNWTKLTLTSSRILTWGSVGWRAAVAERAIKFYIGATMFTASTPSEALETQERELSKRSLITDRAMNFLGSTDCSGQRCNTGQPEIEQAFAQLDQWRAESNAQLEAQNGFLTFEAFSKQFGRSLAEIEIPATLNLIDLLHARRNHNLILLQILEHDQEACGKI